MGIMFGVSPGYTAPPSPVWTRPIRPIGPILPPGIVRPRGQLNEGRVWTSRFDLKTELGTKQQMLDAVRKLDKANGKTHLCKDDIAGLTENARLVAKKYWELRGTARTIQSIQNQLDRPRWQFLEQAPKAKEIIQEIIDDLGN